jgi:hypothetical protein
MFFSKLTLSTLNSWTLLSSGECFIDNKCNFCQFIVAFINKSNETKILIVPLAVEALQTEIKMKYLTRQQEDIDDLSIDEYDLHHIQEPCHVIALYDTPYSGESSSCSFLLNDLCMETFRVKDRKVFMKCRASNCPGKEILEEAGNIAQFVSCGCSVAD